MRRIAVVAVFAICGFVTAHAQNPHIEVDKNNRTISITTSATATSDAELATVHVGFIAYGGDELSAYASGSEKSNAIVTALLNAGVKKLDIQSLNQTVQPVEPYENNSEKLSDAERAKRKFKVNQSWKVVTAAPNASQVLHVAVLAGANDSGETEWSVKDEDALQAQAAGKALERARSIAQSMAMGLGTKLGPLVYASNDAPKAVVVGTLYGVVGGVPGAVPPPPPLVLFPEKVEKSATVYAVFAIE
jgi:uncharacterized protein YggE